MLAAFDNEPAATLLERMEEAQSHIMQLMEKSVQLNFRQSPFGGELANRLSYCEVAS